MTRLFTFLLVATGFLISGHQVPDYTWKQILPQGNGRFEEQWTEGKFPMGITPLIAFNDHLYMIGRKSTWISEDAIHWKAYPKTDWGERYGMSICFFNGKLWMMGGMKSWDHFLNDIWCSEDGLTWTKQKSHAEWPERRGQITISFNDKLWIFGGARSSGFPDKLPAGFYNDAWYSDNGVEWTKASEDVLSGTYNPQLIFYKDKLILIEGKKSIRVWTSENGAQWKTISNNTGLPARQNFGLLHFENQLWIFGGRECHDAWSSADGKTWKQQTAEAPWSARTTDQTVVFKNRIWIYSGKTGKEDSWSGELWAMGPE